MCSGLANNMKLLFIVWILLVQSLEAKLQPVLPLPSNHLAQIIADIIQKYYKPHANNIIFQRAAENHTMFLQQSDLVEQVLWRLPNEQSVLIESAGYERPFMLSDRRLLNVYFLDAAESIG